jgi:hypothetical protein
MALSTRAKIFVENMAKRGEMTYQAIKHAYAGEDAGGVDQSFTFTDLAALNATGVKTGMFGDDAADGGQAYTTYTTGITSPAVPRCVSVTAGAAYDGGNITITGTNQFGAAISEVIIPTQSQKTLGVKAFKTVTSIRKAAVGTGSHATNTLSVGWDNVIGIVATPVSAAATLTLAGVPEAVTIDLTNKTWKPTTAPNATNDYVLTVKVAA